MKKEYKVTVKKRIDGTKIERWFFKDNLHREDGLAYIEYNKDGSIKHEQYWIEGKNHKEDGPAIIDYYKDGSIRYEYYYIEGKRHREDGPAYIEYNKDGAIWYKEYYIEGNKVLPFESRQEFLKRSKSCAGKIVEIDGKKYKLEEVE